LGCGGWRRGKNPARVTKNKYLPGKRCWGKELWFKHRSLRKDFLRKRRTGSGGLRRGNQKGGRETIEMGKVTPSDFLGERLKVTKSRGRVKGKIRTAFVEGKKGVIQSVKLTCGLIKSGLIEESWEK